jgi:hypothetical protein
MIGNAFRHGEVTTSSLSSRVIEGARLLRNGIDELDVDRVIEMEPGPGCALVGDRTGFGAAVALADQDAVFAFDPLLEVSVADLAGDRGEPQRQLEPELARARQ